jgi:hypothetical protein
MTMTTKAYAIRFALGASLLATALGGCSPSEPDTAPVTENSAYEEEAPAEAETPAVVEEAPAPAPAEVKAEAPPAPEIAPDVQMQDDADATGMTARVRRDGSSASEPADDVPATNEMEPQ